jgi:initiation factor 1A
MPNLKGGKKYKSTKGAEETIDYHEIGKDQYVGKVIRSMGNSQVLVYCNDDKIRLCHMRGALKKKRIFINVGDIVLLSLRELGAGVTGAKGNLVKSKEIAIEKGDILAKYSPEIHNKLKREPNINPRIFLTTDVLLNNSAGIPMEDEIDFEFESDEKDDSQEDSDDANTNPIVDKRNKPSHRTAAAAKPSLEKEDGTLDIDAI